MSVLALDPFMLRDRPIEAVVRAVADAGYHAVEWSPREDFLPAGREPHATPEAIRELRRATDDAGVEIASLAVFQEWSSPEPDARASAARSFRRALEVADALGCRRVNTELKGSPLQPEACEAAFRRSLDELLPVAEALSIHITVEPHPYDFIESGDRAVDLVRSVGSAALGYLYCAPHSFIMGSDLRAMIAYAGPSITHVHLADSFQPSRYITNPGGTGVRVHQHLDVDRGEVDWPGLFAGLAEIGYQGPLTVAVFGHPERAEGSFRTNLERVRSLQGAQVDAPAGGR